MNISKDCMTEKLVNEVYEYAKAKETLNEFEKKLLDAFITGLKAGRAIN